VDELLIRYDEAGIEKGFVLPVVNPEIYLPQANEDILDMAAAHPDRIVPFCNVDPRALSFSANAPLDKLLQYYKDKGCKGVGEIMPNMPMRDPMVQNLFACAEKVGLPVTTDGSLVVGGDFGLCDQPGLPQLEYTLATFPNLKMIAHGPIFWGELGGFKTPAQRKPVMRPDGSQTRFYFPEGPLHGETVIHTLFRRFPNLMGELSDAFIVLNCDHDYAAKFLTEFQDRLMFGTDICGFRHPFNILKLLLELRENGTLSETAFQKITRENAVAYFNL
jgi:predicted TIM-barrel fold metal-dependent hydrolase